MARDFYRRTAAALLAYMAIASPASTGPTAHSPRCVVLAGQSNAGFGHAEALRERGLCVIDAHVDGSCLAGPWPGWRPGRGLYQRMLERVGDTPVRAVIWVQGECEGMLEIPYTLPLLELVSAIRADLGAATIVTLLPTRSGQPWYHLVRAAQLRVVRHHPDAFLGADPDTLFATFRDWLHYDEESLARIAAAEKRALLRLRRCPGCERRR